MPKKKKRKEAETAAQIQKANRIPTQGKEAPVMAVRKWEAKSGKQYALFSGPERCGKPRDSNVSRDHHFYERSIVQHIRFKP